MKRKLLLTTMCAFIVCTGSLFSQTATRLAFWDFEGNGTADPYTFYVDDAVMGTIRAWVAPNEFTAENAGAKFSAYREGKDVNGEALVYYQGMTRGTTTIFGASCLASQNWDPIDIRTLRYWYLENISTVGMTDVTISLYLTCAGVGGPGKFKFGYKIGDGPWVEDADFKNVRINVSTSSYVGTDPADLWVHNLPAACNNQAKVSFRWLANDVRADGTAIASTSYSRVDNVEVNAVSMPTGILNAKAEQLVYTAGSRLVGGADAQVTVCTMTGTTIYAGAIAKGASIELPKGIYIVKAVSSGTQPQTIKVIMQ